MKKCWIVTYLYQKGSRALGHCHPTWSFLSLSYRTQPSWDPDCTSVFALERSGWDNLKSVRWFFSNFSRQINVQITCIFQWRLLQTGWVGGQRGRAAHVSDLFKAGMDDPIAGANAKSGTDGGHCDQPKNVLLFAESNQCHFGQRGFNLFSTEEKFKL